MTTSSITSQTGLLLSSYAIDKLDRAALRKLYREVLGQPSDRAVLDRSSEMRSQLSAARDQGMEIYQAEQAALQVEIIPQVEEMIEAAPVEPTFHVTELVMEVLDELSSSAPQTEAAPQVIEPAEKKSQGSKWTAIVEQLWSLREGEEAVEVKIPLEKLMEMGLPTSATTHPSAAAYWNQNPPGIAARKMGLVTSLRTPKDQERYLLIRKA